MWRDVLLDFPRALARALAALDRLELETRRRLNLDALLHRGVAMYLALIGIICLASVAVLVALYFAGLPIAPLLPPAQELPVSAPPISPHRAPRT